MLEGIEMLVLFSTQNDSKFSAPLSQCRVFSYSAFTTQSTEVILGKLTQLK